jgi:prepilin-type N-terminal cleavage/methylation domain-containing protein
MNLSLRKNIPNRKDPSFTLVELLVVVSIIGLLAGLGFPAINGAMKAGKKAEVAAMAEQIKTAVNAFYAEYSTYPVNSNGLVFSNTDKDFLDALSTTNGTGANVRGIIFLEVQPKFTNDIGIVTPQGFDKVRGRIPFYLALDQSNLGYVSPKSASGTSVTTTNVPSSVAVWVDDPDVSGKAVGTFK